MLRLHKALAQNISVFWRYKMVLMSITFSLNFYHFLYNNVRTYNRRSLQTDNLEYKKGLFRRKSFDFCKSVSQLFNIRNTINV